MKPNTAIALALALAAGAAFARTQCKFMPCSKARVAEIAEMLPERPGIPGAHVSNRAVWDRLAATKRGRDVVKGAEKLLEEPIPACPDELFLEFSTPGNGNRTHYERPFFRREAGLKHLTLGECLENKGRFIPRISNYLRTICSERTWCMPAHDAELKAFRGERQNVDLGAQSRALACAIAVHALRGRLPEDVERLARSELERRVFAPLRRLFSDTRATRAAAPHWWFQGPANWTAVCHSGVTRAALAVLEDRADRALFVEAAERSARTFMTGFTDDGYCSEGMGYWNYGWGHFLNLTLAVREATGGMVDFCATPKARKVMEFGTGALLFGETAPDFADGGGNLDRRALQLGHLIWPDLPMTRNALEREPLDGGIGYTVLMDFGQWDGAPAPADAAYPPRTEFPDAQMWVMRPGTSSTPFAFAVKGGHNDEFHNHNDVGSYTLYAWESWASGDAGGTQYTAKTFGPERYTIPMLNSYGHPLPVLNGALQSKGAQYAAKTLGASFTEDRDVVSLQLAGAYDGAKSKAKSLVRTCTYDRRERFVSISDAVDFKGKGRFSVAIVTDGTLEKSPDGGWLLALSGKAEGLKVRVDIDAGGEPFTVSPAERIENEPRISPNRYAITLSSPVNAATVTVKYSAR